MSHFFSIALLLDGSREAWVTHFVDSSSILSKDGSLLCNGCLATFVMALGTVCYFRII